MPDCCSKEKICDDHLIKAFPNLSNLENVTIDTEKIPNWVRNNLIFYKDGGIGEEQLIDTLHYLGNQGIIKEGDKKVI